MATKTLKITYIITVYLSKFGSHNYKLEIKMKKKLLSLTFLTKQS